MNRTLWQLLFALAVASAFFVFGCSDDDNTTTPPPAPTPQERLVGQWDARNNWLDSLNIDQQRYTFTSPDAYHLNQSAGSTAIDFYGTYAATATAIEFHETMEDTTVVDRTYTRNFALSTADSVLTLEYVDGSTNYMIVYDRLP